MTDRWSDLNARRRQIAAWTRTAVAASSAALVLVSVVAAVRSQPINTGGGCGGHGCLTNLRRGQLLVAAMFFAIVFIVAVAWPWCVRRYRAVNGPPS